VLCTASFVSVEDSRLSGARQEVPQTDRNKQGFALGGGRDAGGWGVGGVMGGGRGWWGSGGGGGLGVGGGVGGWGCGSGGWGDNAVTKHVECHDACARTGADHIPVTAGRTSSHHRRQPRSEMSPMHPHFATLGRISGEPLRLPGEPRKNRELRRSPRRRINILVRCEPRLCKMPR